MINYSYFIDGPHIGVLVKTQHLLPTIDIPHCSTSTSYSLTGLPAFIKKYTYRICRTIKHKCSVIGFYSCNLTMINSNMLNKAIEAAILLLEKWEIPTEPATSNISNNQLMLF